MNSGLPLDETYFDTLPRVPVWATSTRVETVEHAAFRSGAALAALRVGLMRAEIPHDLLRARLAVIAAESCVRIAGRPERAGQLRDEHHLLGAGDAPGPAGQVYQAWQKATSQPTSAA